MNSEAEFFMSSPESRKQNLEATVFAVELGYQNKTLRQIDFHGRRTDEIEGDIDRFLVEMYSLKESGCAIVCGTGTGAMKKKVKELLEPYLLGFVAKIIDKGPALLIVFER